MTTYHSYHCLVQFAKIIKRLWWNVWVFWFWRLKYIHMVKWFLIPWLFLTKICILPALKYQFERILRSRIKTTILSIGFLLNKSKQTSVSDFRIWLYMATQGTSNSCSSSSLCWLSAEFNMEAVWLFLCGVDDIGSNARCSWPRKFFLSSWINKKVNTNVTCIGLF